MAYTATYYSEDPDVYGMVMPIRDWEHCQNFCVRTSCLDDERNAPGTDADGDGNSDCHADMLVAGDDPAGRHELDPPGMRCADGYERVINSCDYSVEFADGPRGFKPWRFQNRRRSSYNSMRDGWRWAVHYWSQGVPIKTCAAEAQQREYGLIRTNTDGSPMHCGDVRADTWLSMDPSCGCGPLGVLCQPSLRKYGTVDESRAESRLRSAVEQEPLRIIRSVVASDEDYLSILTTPRSFVNGPLALTWQHQWRALDGEAGIRVTTPIAEPHFSDIEYTDEEWTAYERDAQHSGILTTLEFLLRFPTARSRIAQFRRQFRRQFACSSEFDYAPQPDPMDNNPDISQRVGCSSCHQRLETDGMYFARFPDRTGLFLDEDAFPVMDEICRHCVIGDGDMRETYMHACRVGRSNPLVPGGIVTDPNLMTRCETYFATWDGPFTDREAEYAGHLNPTVYRDPGEYERMELGPAAMVEAELAAGNAMQQCTVRRAWERLVRRSPSSGEIADLAERFEDGGRNYRALIADIVQSSAYRMTTPEATP